MIRKQLKALVDCWKNVSIGLEIETSSVRLIALQKTWSGLALIANDEAGIQPPGDRAATVAATNQLVVKHRLNGADTALHLGWPLIRFCASEAPVMPEGEINDWLQAHAASFLPPHLSVDEFAFSAHVVSEDENRQKLLIAYASRRAIEERLEIVRKAGLRPAMVGAGRLDLAHLAAMVEADFLDAEKTLACIGENDLSLIKTRNGRPAICSEARLENVKVVEPALVGVNKAGFSNDVSVSRLQRNFLRLRGDLLGNDGAATNDAAVV